MGGEPNFSQRVRGCLLGGAIGDALGAGIEFLSLAEIRQRFGAAGTTGFVPAYGREGAITDDTQMTLFTAEGLILAFAKMSEEATGHPVSVVWHAYLRWLATQGMTPRAGAAMRLRSSSNRSPDGWLAGERRLWERRAPGNTCLSALASGEMGTIGDRLNDSKGCGGVMRAAPAGLLPGFSPQECFSLGAETAALTHSHPSGYLSAGALAFVVRALLDGAALTTAIDDSLEELARWEGHEETSRAIDAARRLAARGEAPSPEAVEGLGAGWVGEEALAIALYCALVAEQEGPEGVPGSLLLAVNHSGDSDSTGAIAGNLLGTRWGETALPGTWLEALELRDVIERLADDFVALMSGAA